MKKMTAKQKKAFKELVNDFMLDYGVCEEVAEDMAYDQLEGK